MKWYVGYLVSIAVGILSIIASFTINTDNTNYIETVIIIALLSGFAGGFIAPFHVTRTIKYAATTFTLIASIPLAIILLIASDLSNEEINPLVAVFFLILLAVAAVAIVVTIIIVAIFLYIGALIGSVFGKYFFKEEMYENGSLCANCGAKIVKNVKFCTSCGWQTF